MLRCPAEGEGRAPGREATRVCLRAGGALFFTPQRRQLALDEAWLLLGV